MQLPPAVLSHGLGLHIGDERVVGGEREGRRKTLGATTALPVRCGHTGCGAVVAYGRSTLAALQTHT